jgi:peroxiredoxin Q/BCP
MPQLSEGKRAPDFTLPASTGGTMSLRDFRGKRNVVLYFYPKDMTSGCIKEAAAFRDLKAQFEAAGAVILGVSADSLESHLRFAAKHGLDFPLLSDVGAKVAARYGVYKEKSMYGRTFMGIERTTFVIDKEDRIRRIYPKVKVEKHAEAVLDFVCSLR